MLKANDFRIGNAVKHKRNDETDFRNYFVCGIDVSNDGNIMPILENGNDFYRMSYEHDGKLLAVTLTDELLTSIGYPLQEVAVQNGSWKEYKFGENFKGIICQDGTLEFGYNSFHYGSSLNIKLKYLHQLQNIYYCLNGKEFVIKKW